MTSQLELASNSHWLNWDLYSEKPVNRDEQIESLNTFRKHIAEHIRKAGKKDHLYLLDLHLYPDNSNDKVYKLIGNLSSMPNLNKMVADVRHDHDFYAGGGETSLVVTGVPPPKPKGTDYMPFTRIFSNLREGPGSSALINTGSMI